MVPALRIDPRPLPDTQLGLDPGETAAILLAEEIGADLILIDERAGRAVAESRGIAVRGTLGVLVQARATGSAVPPRDTGAAAHGAQMVRERTPNTYFFGRLSRYRAATLSSHASDRGEKSRSGR